MKKLFVLAIGLLFVQLVNAQVKEPVQWTFSSKKIDATTYEVHMKAAIDKGWHLYSQTTPDGGPVPTAISFTKNPLLTLSGDVTELGKMEKKYEELFEVDVKQYSSQVDFVQVVKVKGKAKTSLSGSIKYMVCNDKECLPPTGKKFTIALK